MNKTELIEFLRNPEKLDNKSFEDLDRLVDKHPYFLSGRLLLTKASKDKKDPKTKSRINSAAVYATDRILLKKYLSGDLFFLQEPPKIHTKKEIKKLEITPARKLNKNLKSSEKDRSKVQIPADPKSTKAVTKEVETKDSIKKVPVKKTATDYDEKPKVADTPTLHLDSLLDELQQDMQNLSSSREKFAGVQQKIEEDDAVSKALENAEKSIEKENTATDAITTKSEQEEESVTQVADEPTKIEAILTEESKSDITSGKEKEPEAKEPEAKEPEAKEPEAKEPEAKEPEAKELTEEKSEEKSESTKEEISQTTNRDSEEEFSKSEEEKPQKRERIPRFAPKKFSTRKSFFKEVEDGDIQEEQVKAEKSTEKSPKEVKALTTEEPSSVSNKTEEKKPNKPKPASKEDEEKKIEAKKSDIIEKFIEDSPSIKYQRDKKQATAADLAEESAEWNENLISEYLAEIYLDQGNKKRSIEIYEALSLKYPEKKSYFADLISKIK